EGAVGALQVHRVVAVGARLDAGVSARDRVVVDADIAVVAASEDHGSVAQGVAGTHAGTGGIDVDDAGVAARGGNQAFGAWTPGFGRLVHAWILQACHGSLSRWRLRQNRSGIFVKILDQKLARGKKFCPDQKSWIPPAENGTGRLFTRTAAPSRFRSVRDRSVSPTRSGRQDTPVSRMDVW